jgi:hypothetical protein
MKPVQTATKAGPEDGRTLRYHAPLIAMGKAASCARGCGWACPGS